MEAALSDIDPAAWSYKANPVEWSIRDCAEHVVMVETAVARRVGSFCEREPEAFDESKSHLKDQLVLRAADRSTKVQAPPTMAPSGRYPSCEAMLSDFRKTHSQLLKIANDFPEWLRGRFTEHMVFKKLDGYQWLLVSSCHTMRHTAQILELKEFQLLHN